VTAGLSQVMSLLTEEERKAFTQRYSELQTPTEAAPGAGR
jgi:hypothetical protein